MSSWKGDGRRCECWPRPPRPSASPASLGTRLGVTDDSLFEGLTENHPRAPELALYAYLSWLQEQLVEALSAEL